MKKHNQAKQHFGYKNDTSELVELGQFIREAFPNVRVEREWCVFYDQFDRYIGVGKNMPEGRICKFKTPDLMLIDKKTNKLLCCVELDGSVHDTMGFGDTMDRDELYKTLGIDLIVVNKSTIEVSMFDDAYGKIERVLEGKMHAK